ncbi:MAG: RNA pyrophosphohydrolase [Gammaproteobacteria bacterium]|nr:RNA pyrophosphohydrolase [Gammaproteobacteria bacterium]
MPFPFRSHERRGRLLRRGSIIDGDGYRANVGIVLCNAAGQLFWGRRSGMEAWQFPQGGIRPNEEVESAMFRELREEIGLLPEDVEVLGCTRGWLRYDLPQRFVRTGSRPVCIGQKQVWYLLRLIADERKLCLDTSQRPEFDYWRWIEFWQPAVEVVDFKRDVYRRALGELEPLLPAKTGCTVAESSPAR